MQNLNPDLDSPWRPLSKTHIEKILEISKIWIQILHFIIWYVCGNALKISKKIQFRQVAT